MILDAMPPKTKSLCMYNNKGGVSKTTTLFNVAAYLSKLGKEILICDFDSQCNATELFFASDSDVVGPEKNLKGSSILSVFRKRFAGEAARVDVEKIEFAESRIYPKLHLLRGDISFSSADPYFAEAWNHGLGQEMHQKNTYTSIRNLFEDLSYNYDFDYIFCDLGPSTNYTNRLVLLSCDGFFIPMFPDRFNFQAISGIFGHTPEFTESIPAWIFKHELHASVFPPTIEPFKGKPKFLGAILTLNNRDNSGSNISLNAWERFLRIKLNDFLANDCKVPCRHGLDPREPFSAMIDYLGLLPSLAHSVGKAIFDLEDADMSGRGEGFIRNMCGILPTKIPDEWFESRDAYNGEIKKIADTLENA